MTRRPLVLLAGASLVAVLAALALLASAPPALASPVRTAGFLAGPASTPPLPAGWRPPLGEPLRVLRGFSPPPPDQPWLGGHRGVDLAAPAGAAVRASAAGMVTFAGPLAGRSVMVVRHGALRSTYEPVRAAVRVGATVVSGQVVGWLQGLTLHCGQPCLHWGLLVGDRYLDPLVGRRTIRLLPFLDSRASVAGAPAQPGSETAALARLTRAAARASSNAGIQSGRSASGHATRIIAAAAGGGAVVAGGALGLAGVRLRARSPTGPPD